MLAKAPCQPKWRQRRLETSGLSDTVTSKSCSHRSSPPPTMTTPASKSTTTQTTSGRDRWSMGSCPFLYAVRPWTLRRRWNINSMEPAFKPRNRRVQRYAVFADGSFGSLPASSAFLFLRGPSAGESGHPLRPSPPPLCQEGHLRGTRGIPAHQNQTPRRYQADPPFRT